MRLVDGWIHPREMEFVYQFMASDLGSILEVGSANGRLFSFLQPLKPNWSYHAVDPWEREGVRLQKDWKKGYFDQDNLGELVTMEMFKVNCPFADAHNAYFSEFETKERFDVISLGLIGNGIDWQETYRKANSLLKTSGVIIGRNHNHYRYGEMIRAAASGYVLIDRCDGSFAVERNDD